MGKKHSGSAPSIDPAVGEAMKQQAATLERQQQWYENELYPWMKQQADLANANAQTDRENALKFQNWYQDITEDQVAKQNALYDKQMDYADTFYNRWQNDIKPVEDALIADAKRYNTSAEAERQAALAIGDVATSAAAMKQANNMQMQAYGINPTAGAYQSQQRAAALNQAALQASAANQARAAAEQLGWNKKAQIAALGQQYIGNSNQSTALGAGITTNLGNASANQANSYGQQATALGNAGLGNVGAVANVGLNSYQALTNGWGNYGNLGLGASNYNLNAWNATQANKRAQNNQFWSNLNSGFSFIDTYFPMQGSAIGSFGPNSLQQFNTFAGPSAYNQMGQGTAGFASAIGKF